MNMGDSPSLASSAATPTHRPPQTHSQETQESINEWIDRLRMDTILSVAHVCPGAWAMSDISTLDWEDVALYESGRGRKARMVESFFVIHSSLSS